MSLAELLIACADARERQLGVAMPGIVISYDSGTRTASVRPAVNRLVPASDTPDEDVSETIPALQNVPVCWPRGRNFSLVGTLLPGDPILLICMDRDISSWRASGAVSDPLDTRTHSWASAVAIPGLMPDAPSFVPAPTDAAALASSVLAELQAVKADLADVRAAFNGHTHAGAFGGTGSAAALTSGPTTAPAGVPPVSISAPHTPGSVASSVLLLGG